MLSQIPGKGAFYVIAFTDGEGAALAGGTNYMLNLPKDVPAANFWSVTLTKPRTPAFSTASPSCRSIARHPSPECRWQHRSPLGRKPQPARSGTGLPPCLTRYFAVLRLYGPTAPAL
jgi:hypothetical protein